MISGDSLSMGVPPVSVPSYPVMKTPGSPFSAVTTVSFSEDMNPRYRSTMEDASAILDCFSGDSGTGYFGVYDGHGGRNVAEFLRLHLHVNVENELKLKGDRSVEECLRAAFLYTDVMCKGTGEQASGSTAVVCIVRRDSSTDSRYVYTANCGDARAVLCHEGQAVRLSKDHKATDIMERTRIEAAGGFVVRKRVMGVLAVARSFGDFVLKKFVSAEPYTSTTKLNEHSEFIIIACDGIWDVLEDQEAVDLVREYLRNSPGGITAAHGGKELAGVLVKASLEKGSTDNVTSCVVVL